MCYLLSQPRRWGSGQALGLGVPPLQFAQNDVIFIAPVRSNTLYRGHIVLLWGIRLDSLEAMKTGGKRGTALTVGDPETPFSSRL